MPGGRRRRLAIVECNSGTDYATLSANTAAASDLYQIVCHFDQNLATFTDAESRLNTIFLLLIFNVVC